MNGKLDMSEEEYKKTSRIMDTNGEVVEEGCSFRVVIKVKKQLGRSLRSGVL